MVECFMGRISEFGEPRKHLPNRSECNGMQFMNIYFDEHLKPILHCHFLLSTSPAISLPSQLAPFVKSHFLELSYWILYLFKLKTTCLVHSGKKLLEEARVKSTTAIWGKREHKLKAESGYERIVQRCSFYSFKCSRLLLSNYFSRGSNRLFVRPEWTQMIAKINICKFQ